MFALNSVLNLLFSSETRQTNVPMFFLLRGGWFGLGAFFKDSIMSARALLTSVNPNFFKVASSGRALPSREFG